MLSSVFMFLLGGSYLMLRLGPVAGSFPRPLRPAEEAELLNRWETGDMEARNLLIEHNLRLVAHIIKKYYTQTGDADDLISIGTIGLIKGISTYRREKGVRLATYASKCIENEILMHFRAQRKTAGDVSLSDSIDAEGDGASLSFLDIVSQEDDMFERVAAEDTRAALRESVDRVLTDREARIIRLRYGLAGSAPLPQREVAEKMGISRSYVSRPR